MCDMSARYSVVERCRVAELPLRDQPLLVFAKHGPAMVGQVDERYVITFGDATRNICVLGGTGRGKTESIMLPAAARMIANDCVGLVLDAKGDFVILSDQFPERTMVIGPGYASQINLLGGNDVSVFRALIEEMHGKYHQHEKYWGSMGVEDAILIFLYVRESGHEPTLKDIHDGLAEPKPFCLQLERFLRSREKISKALIDQIKSRKQDEFGMLRLGGFLGIESESPRAAEQYSWQTNAIVKSLAVIVSNPELERAFCTAGSPDVAQLAFSDQKTLILDVNADEYPDAAFTIGRMLRLQYMRAVSTTYRERQVLGVGRDVFSFMLIDEYQQYVNAAVHRQTDSLRDDNTWFDRSRSYGHINIVATQSMSSLFAQVDRSAADTIVQNCRTSIILPSTDVPTLNRAALLAGSANGGSVARDSLLNPGAQGEGFVHIANSGACHGGSLGGLMKAGVIVDQRYAFMNAFIGVNKRNVQVARPTPLPAIVENPFTGKRPVSCSGILHVVVNRELPEAGDWLAGLTANPRIRFVGIVDFLGQRKVHWTKRESYGDYAESVEPGDVVLIPVFADKQQSRVLLSRQLFDLVEAMRKAGATILVGPTDESMLDLERKADSLLSSTEAMRVTAQELLDAGNDVAA